MLALPARRDMDLIIRQSRQAFGEEAATRYRRLMTAAFQELVEEPQRPASRLESSASSPVWLYHLRHVARRQSGLRLANPRHFVAYRFDSDRVDVVRVLHDAMDFEAQLKG